MSSPPSTAEVPFCDPTSSLKARQSIADMSSTLKRRQFQTTDPVEVDSLDGYHTFGLSLPACEHPIEVVSMEYCPATDSQPRKYSTCRTYVLIAACLCDFVLLGVLGFVEYLLRWGSYFPFRMKRFRCEDPQLNVVTDNAVEFPLLMTLSSPLVFSVSLCLPVALILVTELILWLSVGSRKPDIHLKLPCCPKLTLFQNVRRMDRYVVSQLFGAFATMIFVDVLKNLMGVQRPHFLAICKPTCRQPNDILQIQNCSLENPSIRRDISTSFPSIQAALSMYAAVSVTLYLYGVTKLHHSKYMLKPFFCLSCLLLALCCGAMRVAAGQSWWSDTVAGQVIGAGIAAYMGIAVMRKYDPQLHISNRKLVDQILALEARLMTMKTSNKESYSLPAAAGGRSFEMSNMNAGRHRTKPSPNPRYEVVPPEVPEHQRAHFNEFSNTFRDELKRTLHASGQRNAGREDDEPEDVFYP